MAALNLNESSDKFEGSEKTSSPYTIIDVVDLDSTGSESVITDSIGYKRSSFKWNGSRWELDASDSITGSSDPSASIVAGYLDNGGNNSLIYEGTTQTASGNAGGSNVDGLRIGESRSGSGHFGGVIGHIEIYSGKPDVGIVSRIETIASEWSLDI